MIADGLSRQAPLQENKSGPRAHIYSVSLDAQNIRQMQKDDVLAKGIAIALLHKSYPAQADLRGKIMKLTETAHLDDGIVYVNNKIYAPLNLRHNIMTLAHDNPAAGHMGPAKTLYNIAKQWFWISMASDVKAYCRQCHECAKVNPAPNKQPNPLGPMPIPERLFERVHIDLLQLPKTKTGYKYMLVMVDSFSKWIEVAPLPDKTADGVAKAFVDEWICRHGVPDSIFSDHGSEFDNALFKEIQNLLKFEHHFSTAGHPASNGQVERVNRNVITYFQKFIPNGSEWDRHLSFMRMAHNTSMHEAIKTTPFNVVYLHDPQLPKNAILNQRRHYGENYAGEMSNRLAAAYSSVESKLHQTFAQTKAAHDKRAKERQFKVGDRVYITAFAQSNKPKKFQDKFTGPYTIIEMHAPDVVTVRLNNSAKTLKVNTERLKLVPYRELFIDDKTAPSRPPTDPVNDPPAPNLPSSNRQRPRSNSPAKNPTTTQTPRAKSADAHQPTIFPPKPLDVDRSPHPSTSRAKNIKESQAKQAQGQVRSPYNLRPRKAKVSSSFYFDPTESHGAKRASPNTWYVTATQRSPLKYLSRRRRLLLLDDPQHSKWAQDDLNDDLEPIFPQHSTPLRPTPRLRQRITPRSSRRRLHRGGAPPTWSFSEGQSDWELAEGEAEDIEEESSDEEEDAFISPQSRAHQTLSDWELDVEIESPASASFRSPSSSLVDPNRTIAVDPAYSSSDEDAEPPPRPSRPPLRPTQRGYTNVPFQTSTRSGRRPRWDDSRDASRQ